MAEVDIEVPDVWEAFRAQADAKAETHDDHCGETVGEPLDGPVEHLVPAYYEKLEFGDEDIARNKRDEVLGLYWGRIEQDGAALVGLGAALQNLSETIGRNVAEVAGQWSGESYEAFKAAMDKVRTTLDAYRAGAEKAGGILLEAMTQARAMYQDYATASQEALSFEGAVPPESWHKLSEGTGQHLANVCPCFPDPAQPTDVLPQCAKNHGDVVPLLDGEFVTTRQLEACEADPCEFDVDRVRVMYGNLVRHGKADREAIRTRVREWCDATDDFKKKIEGVLDVAVGNVYKLAQSRAFSSLRVVGGDEGSTGGAPSAEPVVDPTTSAAPEATPDPETAPESEPASEEAVPSVGAVTIKDGDRTIGVTDVGDGHVTVTVVDAGGTKTYDLDFDAASGLTKSAEVPVADGVEHVPAHTNGKCVIQNGDVTITAERPLFAPDQITLTVVEGTGTPTTYTVDFPDEPEETAPPEEGNSTTAPQAWIEDARGSVSGVLTPDRSDGEAELAAAPDAHGAAGMVGAGLPLLTSSGSNNSGEGRAGSGWSVHGDLFDSAEPVYSMHGVLGNDDREPERR